MGNPLLMLAGAIPMLVLLGSVLWERRKKKALGDRPPIQEKLLRLPGHTLSQQMAQTWESFSTWAFVAGLFSVVPSILLSRTTGKETAVEIWVIVIINSLFVAISTVIAWRSLLTLHKLRLGLLGEQAVAEQLQGLLAQGYRVFHDIPGDGAWNIDHVVVGPAGVFAIETKCRAKRRPTNGLREQDAVFDGKRIQFPWGDDLKAVEQARRNSKWLARMLSNATGESIASQAIVALPGWWVTLKTNSDVKVLNSKQVPGFIGNEPTRLSGKTIQQITYQLEHRCRDVEF